MIDKLLTPPEVAERLRVSIKTIRREVKRGKLVCERIGSRMRFTEAQIATYLEQQQSTARAPQIKPDAEPAAAAPPAAPRYSARARDRTPSGRLEAVLEAAAFLAQHGRN